MTTTLPIGPYLRLVSDTQVGDYVFHPDRHVRATLGMKDGAICAPIFNYRILSEGSVEIFDSNGVVWTWTRIRIEGELLHADVNGEASTFTIERRTP